MKDFFSIFIKKPRFSNRYVKDVKRKIYHYLLWKIGYYRDNQEENLQKSYDSFSEKDIKRKQDRPYAIWINHSTFLIHVDGFVIITDPIWASCCSPLRFLGPKRRHEPGLAVTDLNQVDIVLISHNHYDHLDKKTVKILHKRFPNILWVVPKGLKRWFEKKKIFHVKELGWYENIPVSKDKERKGVIHAVPAQHFSGRGIFDLNKTLWVGYVVEIETPKYGLKRFYFGGDTGYNPSDFKEIGSRWNQMDLSLIPIGAYYPRKFMHPVHINPKEAVTIHQEVKSKLSIGMHWGTFRLSDEPLNRPPEDLFLAMKDADVDPDTFMVLKPGESVHW